MLRDSQYLRKYIALAGSLLSVVHIMMPNARSGHHLPAQNRKKKGIMKKALASSLALYQRTDVRQPEGLKEDGIRKANLEPVERHARTVGEPPERMQQQAYQKSAI